MKINKDIELTRLDATRTPRLTAKSGEAALFFDVKMDGASAKLAVHGDQLAKRFAEELASIDLGPDDKIVTNGYVNRNNVTPFINVNEKDGHFVHIVRAADATKSANAGKVYVAGYYRNK